MTKRTRCLALFELAFRGLGLVVGCVVRVRYGRESAQSEFSAFGLNAGAVAVICPFKAKA